MENLLIGSLLILSVIAANTLVSANSTLAQALPTNITVRPLQLADSTQSNVSNTFNVGKQSAAPYAIEDAAPALGQAEAPSEQVGGQPKAGLKNLVFRLSLNQTTRDEFERQHQGRDESWTLMNRNGSSSSESGANLDLRKLLDALSSNNNFTSEVMMDNQHPGTLNITITNVRNSSLDNREHLFLEDLLNESRSAINGSSILIDNHRFISKHPIRSKAPVFLVSTATVPPIRQTVDLMAENYTSRKVADEANVFALNLLHQMNVEALGSHNMVQSPFVVYQGLSLLLSGASGDTSRELDRVLLGNQQSIYENTRLTHDQDRSRLLASFNEVVGQLYQSATNHFKPDSCSNNSSALDCAPTDRLYGGGSETQHLIMANNLLFSPAAYEISNEFKNLLANPYNNTVTTKIEVGSTESIQVLNGWIRRTTNGLIPAIFNKKSTFDEFNVMTLLSTSWLTQEWRDQFRRVSSSLRSLIRLKGQNNHVRGQKSLTEKDEPLLEFVDDNKGSHFVDYIESETTSNIHHHHVIVNNMMTDVVTVPFHNSNQKLVVLTPMAGTTFNNTPIQPSDGSAQEINEVANNFELPDTSLLSKLIAAMASNPRKAMRSLWNTIAPEIITKKLYQNMRQASGVQRNQSTTHGNTNLSQPPLVRLSIPLVKIEADASLSASLNHMGLVNSFDPTQANYIGINGHPFNYNKLHLSNVLYKTTLNLNEFGINYDRTIRTLESMRISPNRRQPGGGPSEATNDTLDDHRGLIDEIKLNKPFVYMICDTKTKLVLYTGVVRNPTK